MVDEVVVRRILASVGLNVWAYYGGKGKAHLLKSLHGYNVSAQRSAWVVVVDLDRDFGCAPEAVAAWLPWAAHLMRLRIAVREVESWLLADRQRMAGFLGCPIGALPRAPDELADPKAEVVRLARRSRRRDVREGLVPHAGSRRSEGPTYASDLAAFARDRWRPEQAAGGSPSLARALARLRELAEAG